MQHKTWPGTSDTTPCKGTYGRKQDKDMMRADVVDPSELGFVLQQARSKIQHSSQPLEQQENDQRFEIFEVSPSCILCSNNVFRKHTHSIKNKVSQDCMKVAWCILLT